MLCTNNSLKGNFKKPASQTNTFSTDASKDVISDILGTQTKVQLSFPEFYNLVTLGYIPNTVLIF